MAPPAGTLRVGRYFLALIAIFAVIYGLVFLPGQRHTPKLGLDLQGGKQVVYEAKTPNGKTPAKSAMSEARQIMEDRVNGSGVAEAEVVVQGTNQISVSIPGKSTKDISKLGEAANLNFRPVVMPPISATAATTPVPTSTATTGASTPAGSTSPATTAPAASSPPTGSSSPASPQANAVRPLNAPTSSAGASTPASTKTTPAPAASATPAPSATASAPPVKKTATPFKNLGFPLPTSDTEFNKLSQAQQQELQAAMATYDCTADQPDDRTKDLIACDSKAAGKATAIYLLGPVIVAGTEISSASAVAPNVGGQGGSAVWTVSLNLKTTGSGQWAKYTGAHNTGGQDTTTSISQCGSTGTPCADYVAFTLDGAVISAPYNRDAINGQATQISGGFDESSANQLARQLKYGALPLNFRVLTNSDVSATLGTAQLKAGLLAGGIGLILVVIYSLIYYRALGLVTIASLLVSGGLTFGCLVVLGREIGFTLTLAGIAGFIVAVGITADSFVVFFERIKDEVHEGRSMRVAVPRAWVRARRTILSADTVSFLAAAVLYYFAAGDVKGFAFALGLSTILDLVVVFLFTHPIVSLLSRSKAFGSARFTGLNAVRTGGVVPDSVGEAPASPARRARPEKVAASAKAKSAPVVLLEEDEVESAVEPDEPVVPPASEDAAPAPTTSRARAATSEPDQPERARSAPEPGTAAERAAARRAKMRARKGDEKGQR